MNKQIIFAIFTCLIFCSCEPNATSKGREAYKKYFQKTLKDPSSLVIHSEEVITQDESSTTFVLDVGAKNSFGGMVRQTYTIRTVGKSVLDVTEYDVRLLPKASKVEKHFIYQNKMIPSIGFNPEEYINKEYILSDSCIYTNTFYDLSESVKAAKNGDINKIEYLGGILSSGSKVYIKSVKETSFEVESELHKDINIYIEQSAIF